MHNELTLGVAARIRELYISRRAMHAKFLRDMSVPYSDGKLHPKWDGGRDVRGIEHRPIWPKLAEVAIEQSIDPAAWVDALFAHAADFDHVPWPSDLTNKRILKDAATWALKQAEEACNRVQTELLNLEKECWLRSMASSLPAGDLSRSVVCDPRTDASPLVRYVFAYALGDADVAAGFEAAAKVQYAAAPKAYQEALGKRLPPHFVDKK